MLTLGIRSLALFAALAATGLARAESPASAPEKHLQEFRSRLAVIKEVATLTITPPPDRGACIRGKHNAILRTATDAFSNPNYLAPGGTPEQYEAAILCAAAKLQTECVRTECGADVRTCADLREYERTESRYCAKQ